MQYFRIRSRKQNNFHFQMLWFRWRKSPALIGFHGPLNGQLARWQSQEYTASLFLQSGKRQRHSKWPRRPVVTSGTGIVHRYQAGPLNRKTTHQNSPLHLRLEVSVNESHMRLRVVHTECQMCDVLYMSSAEIKPGLAPENWLEQVVNTASNPPQHLMVSTTGSLIKYMAFTVWNHTSDILAWSWNTREKAAVNSLKVDRLRYKLQWETLTSLNRQRRNLDPACDSFNTKDNVKKKAFRRTLLTRIASHYLELEIIIQHFQVEILH